MLEKFKQWIMKNYSFDRNEPVENLVWVKRKLNNKTPIEWSYVDTVDFDISSIPTRKELIIDCHKKQLEDVKNELFKGGRRQISTERH